jgi:shikimate kinase
MSEKSVLYLVGFMGTGKTAVGRCMAAMLDWTFIDLDQEIEKAAGSTIAGIFRRHGEAHFRALESAQLRRAALCRNTVIATGGGACNSAENQEIMRSTGGRVWLDAPLELLYRRCCEQPELRPLWGSREEMEQLLERRRPFYSQAEVRVSAVDGSVEDLARHILQLLFPGRPG